MSVDHSAIASAIRNFIIEDLLNGEGANELNDETELVQTGIVDSINVLNLVEFIEERYDIELEPGDIQKFTSIANITGGIAGKLGE